MTAVSTNNDTTPSYTFSSNEAGTISYGGSCSSSTTSATANNNTITFNTLSAGTYSNCTINVTDEAGNISDTLAINSFRVGVIIFKSMRVFVTSLLCSIQMISGSYILLNEYLPLIMILFSSCLFGEKHTTILYFGSLLQIK